MHKILTFLNQMLNFGSWRNMICCNMICGIFIQLFYAVVMILNTMLWSIFWEFHSAGSVVGFKVVFCDAVLYHQKHFVSNDNNNNNNSDSDNAYNITLSFVTVKICLFQSLQLHHFHSIFMSVFNQEWSIVTSTTFLKLEWIDVYFMKNKIWISSVSIFSKEDEVAVENLTQLEDGVTSVRGKIYMWVKSFFICL